MINVGIIGATGHTGEELIAVLLNHPKVTLTALFNTSDETKDIAEFFPRFKGRISMPCGKVDLDALQARCECVFLALPHTVSMEFAPKLLKMGKRVIDLSADYRLDEPDVYERHYKTPHKDSGTLKHAVYGLPEIYRENIASAKLVANPGCYPTCALLALAPLMSMELADPKEPVIIDAKSGVSGAGKKLAKEFLFVEANEDFRAYKVNAHQHMPEIEQILSRLAGVKSKIIFVPHLLPLQRGILETIYVKKAPGAEMKADSVTALYRKFYKQEPFVRVRDTHDYPRLKDVAGTNLCDISIKEEEGHYIVVACIDNLLKGASGQAVQNMNIMYQLPETAGLA